MNNGHTNVLLIEDNPGDADLVRLRLVESQSDVQVNCVPRLSDALACLDAETPSLVARRDDLVSNPRKKLFLTAVLTSHQLPHPSSPFSTPTPVYIKPIRETGVMGCDGRIGDHVGQESLDRIGLSIATSSNAIARWVSLFWLFYRALGLSGQARFFGI